MKLIPSVILFFATISGCKNKPYTDYAILIKGDWVSINTSSLNREQPYVFSFADSLCTAFNPYREYRLFSIQVNRLTITPGEVISADEPTTFLIQKLDADSLILAPESAKVENKTILRLSKVKAQNLVNPSKIYFASSGCYGSCPAMFLTVDSNRNIQFYGTAYTHLKGGHNGTIPLKEYKLLLEKTRALNLDALQNHYDAGWSDDQTCGISIIIPGKTIRTAVYGYNKEPVELRILLNYMMQLYQNCDLKKNNLTEPEFFIANPEFENVRTAVLPPPVPPPALK